VIFWIALRADIIEEQYPRLFLENTYLVAPFLGWVYGKEILSLQRYYTII